MCLPTTEKSPVLQRRMVDDWTFFKTKTIRFIKLDFRYFIYFSYIFYASEHEQDGEVQCVAPPIATAKLALLMSLVYTTLIGQIYVYDFFYSYQYLVWSTIPIRYRHVATDKNITGSDSCQVWLPCHRWFRRVSGSFIFRQLSAKKKVCKKWHTCEILNHVLT